MGAEIGVSRAGSLNQGRSAQSEILRADWVLHQRRIISLMCTTF
jgi:hypothetical protein